MEKLKAGEKIKKGQAVFIDDKGHIRPTIKKLESRQDVLDVWVSKGAILHGLQLHNIEGVYGTQAVFSNETKKSRNYFCLYEILYSPESNFFLAMFGNIRDGYHKKNCVDSLAPLQYLKDNLNDTLCSQQEDSFLQEVNAWDMEKSTE